MSEGTADPVFTPEEVQGALDKLRKKYGHTREIARTLAWVAGHATQLAMIEGVPRNLSSYVSELRRGRGFSVSGSQETEMLEQVIHATHFQRDFNKPHVIYCESVKRMVRGWSADLHEQLTDHILETLDILEGIDSEVLVDLAENLWDLDAERVARDSLRAAFQREQSKELAEQYAAKRRAQESERQLQELLDEEAMRATARGTW
jgi:predicted DsbA family dithiol-disulfide isomerase